MLDTILATDDQINFYNRLRNKNLFTNYMAHFSNTFKSKIKQNVISGKIREERQYSLVIMETRLFFLQFSAIQYTGCIL